MKLNLKLYDRVRNIRNGSSRNGMTGTVRHVDGQTYTVVWANGDRQDYLRRFAHLNLERVVDEESRQCKCVHDEVCLRCSRQIQKLINWPFMYGSGVKTLADAYGAGKKLVKRERRNVITGKTQSEMISKCGAAAGVAQFNTRALGMTTGQALVKLGEAMMHPDVPVRVQDVDHAITQHGTPRWVANNHFRGVLEGLIESNKLKGFRFEHGNLIYNPIVTEETYVQ